MKNNYSEIFTMPAGSYICGDPCYFFSDKPHEDWLEFLEKNDFYDNKGQGFLVGTNLPVVVFGTKYGDGFYEDNFGRKYGVDSGLIGIIRYTEGSDIPFLMHLVEFEEEFDCMDNNGYLHFGDIVIDTVQDGYEEDNDEENDEENEGDWDEI